jgi:hypothetical protein
MGWINDIADKLKPADQRASAIAKAKVDAEKEREAARKEAARKEAEKDVKAIQFKRGGVAKSSGFKW